MMFQVCQLSSKTVAGEQWRALTRIKVRKEPSINSAQLEDKVIEKGPKAMLNGPWVKMGPVLIFRFHECWASVAVACIALLMSFDLIQQDEEIALHSCCGGETFFVAEVRRAKIPTGTAQHAPHPTDPHRNQVTSIDSTFALRPAKATALDVAGECRGFILKVFFYVFLHDLVLPLM